MITERAKNSIIIVTCNGCGSVFAAAVIRYGCANDLWNEYKDDLHSTIDVIEMPSVTLEKCKCAAAPDPGEKP